MNALKIGLLAGALLTVAGSAAAQPEMGGRGGPGGEQTRDEAVARADRLFDLMDGNHDGRVTADEARQVMERARAERGGPDGPGGPGMGLGGPGGPAAMFDRLDADHNGVLSRDEFMRMPPPRGPEGPGGPGMGPGGPGGRGMEMMMRQFGPDGVTRDEWRARQLQRFDRVDLNHDGRITPEEREQARARMQGMRGGMGGMGQPGGDRPETDGN